MATHLIILITNLPDLCLDPGEYVVYVSLQRHNDVGRCLINLKPFHLFLQQSLKTDNPLKSFKSEHNWFGFLPATQTTHGSVALWVDLGTTAMQRSLTRASGPNPS
jgi:hypothetical protein